MKLIRHLVQFAGLILLVTTTALSQTPTSGAALTINGSVGSIAVNQNIYDSQIHTGNVISVGANCSAGDAAYLTDAYVLQGGSPTGCDPGDAFETTQGTGTATIAGTGYSFAIETQYLQNNNDDDENTYCTSPGVTPQICAAPDTGFLTVTNNSGSAFTGTITLSGTAVNPQAGFCGSGVASTTYTNGLDNGASVVLALSSDSSNCGGWNADQTLTLTAGATTKFPFGTDAYEITPFNSAAGDQLIVRPVPTPQSLFSLGVNSPFSGQNCVPYADTSAPAGAINGPNPVCVELQVTCPYPGCSDSGQFLYDAQADYAIDPVSLPNGIGGPAFLGRHGESCPPSVFDINIFDSYSQDPTKGVGTGTGSCYVATYSPTAPPVQSAQQQTLVGFQSPVRDGQLNVIKAGSAVPLIWQTFDISGNPVTNLSLCGNTSGTSCSTPWVFVGTIAIDCSSFKVLSGATIQKAASAGGSGLQNEGNGTYQFDWKTVKGSTGCVTPVLLFSTGYVSLDVAEFQYK